MSYKQALVEYLSQYVTPRRLRLFEEVLAKRTRMVKVVLADIQDPNDANAVLRSCECFGIQDVLVANDSEQSYKVTRGVSVGAAKWVDVSRPNDGVATTLKDLKAKGYGIAAVSSAGEPIQSLAVNGPLALVFGDDLDDLSEPVREAADMVVGVPTVGFSSGFNVSVYAALILANVRKRLVNHGLTPQESLDLKLTWLAKMPKQAKQIMARFLEEQNLSLSALALTPEQHKLLAPSD